MRNVDKNDVPAVTVPRLAVYLRKLRELRARGIDRVSSKDLAESIGLNAAQIRKDFSYFGEFGTRGVGYEVARLIEEISHCLGLDHTWNVIIVGAGLLGTALARYRGFSEQGFRLVGMFDSSATVIGASYGTGRCAASPTWRSSAAAKRWTSPWSPCRPARPSHGGRLAGGRRQGHAQLRPGEGAGPAGALVRQVDLSSELMSLTFYLDHKQA